MKHFKKNKWHHRRILFLGIQYPELFFGGGEEFVKVLIRFDYLEKLLSNVI